MNKIAIFTWFLTVVLWFNPTCTMQLVSRALFASASRSGSRNLTNNPKNINSQYNRGQSGSYNTDSRNSSNARSVHSSNLSSSRLFSRDFKSSPNSNAKTIAHILDTGFVATSTNTLLDNKDKNLSIINQTRTLYKSYKQNFDKNILKKLILSIDKNSDILFQNEEDIDFFGTLFRNEIYLNSDRPDVGSDFKNLLQSVLQKHQDQLLLIDSGRRLIIESVIYFKENADLAKSYLEKIICFKLNNIDTCDFSFSYLEEYFHDKGMPKDKKFKKHVRSIVCKLQNILLHSESGRELLIRYTESEKEISSLEKNMENQLDKMCQSETGLKLLYRVFGNSKEKALSTKPSFRTKVSSIAFKNFAQLITRNGLHLLREITLDKTKNNSSDIVALHGKTFLQEVDTLFTSDNGKLIILNVLKALNGKNTIDINLLADDINLLADKFLQYISYKDLEINIFDNEIDKLIAQEISKVDTYITQSVLISNISSRIKESGNLSFLKDLLKYNSHSTSSYCDKSKSDAEKIFDGFFESLFDNKYSLSKPNYEQIKIYFDAIVHALTFTTCKSDESLEQLLKCTEDLSKTKLGGKFLTNLLLNMLKEVNQESDIKNIVSKIFIAILPYRNNHNYEIFLKLYKLIPDNTELTTIFKTAMESNNSLQDHIIHSAMIANNDCSTNIHMQKHPAAILKFLRNFPQQTYNGLYTISQNVTKKAKELESQGYVTFVHGQRWNYHFIEQWYTKLYQECTPNGANNDFLFAHIEKPITDPIELQQEKNLRVNLVKHGVKENFKKERRVLYMNYAFWANASYAGSNSASYVAENSNFSSLKVTIENVFSHLNFESIYIKYKNELEQLEQLHNNASKLGNMLLIAIPQQKLKECVYVGNIHAQKEGNIKQVINGIKNKTDIPDKIQFCLTMTWDEQGGLNPASGIKIFAFNSPEQEAWQKYLQAEQALWEKIKADIRQSKTDKANSIRNETLQRFMKYFAR